MTLNAALLHGRRKPVARVGGDVPPERDHERLQPPLVGGTLVVRLGRCVGVAEIVERNGGGLGGQGRPSGPAARTTRKDSNDRARRIANLA